MKKTAWTVLALISVMLAGCLSAPVPQELVDVGPRPPAEPLTIREVVRLSQAGVSDDVIVEQIRRRGVAEKLASHQVFALRNCGVTEQVRLHLLASPALLPSKPLPKIVYRDLYIPLWPSYARGSWRLGLRIGCWYREKAEEPPPRKVEPLEPVPTIIDP